MSTRRTLQYLEKGTWVDVDCRATTEAGMIKRYNADKKEDKPPSGMRIITIHKQFLGWAKLEESQ